MSSELVQRIRALLRRAGLSRVPEPVLGAAALFASAALVWALWRFWPSDGGTVAFDGSSAGSGVVTSASASAAASSPASSAESSNGSSAECVVDVEGAVRRAGVYHLAAGSRVQDAIDAAGGVLGNAAPQGVNRARAVADGEQIVVPTRDQWAKSGGSVPAGAQGAAAARGGSGSSAGGAASGPVDINSADAALLDTLPGVGPSTAAKIVADRAANGRFATVDDLARVPGIGPKKLDSLKGLICAR